MTRRTDAQRRAELRRLFEAAGLDIAEDDLQRVADLVRENDGSAERVASRLARFSEPAFGFPARRKIGP